MSVPVISVAQMREWEQASWAAGQTQAHVIARVGEIIGRRARQLTRRGDFILILAGKGHNGDDARAAQEHLTDRRVHLQNLKDPLETGELTARLDQRPALIIDGLFGIGINRPLDEHWIALLRRINEAKTRVLAVDIPSGLNADTGEPQGAAIEATVTLTVGAPKRGMLLPPAEPYVGRLEVAPDIGLAGCPISGAEALWTLPEDFIGYPPPRNASANKGNFGHLSIVAGSLGYHGAAVMSARGAQRAQPGLITLYAQEIIYLAIAPQLQAVMVAVWERNTKLPGNAKATLIGPGLAAADLPDEIKMLTRLLWRDSPMPVVVDASALDWVPLSPGPKNAIRVLTPHPGEAARLLRTTAQQVQSNRPLALREVSRRFGNCWVVLKGQQTLIGRSAGEIYVNPSGNPFLAQGGSGDVLSGYLAGLLAQPALQADPLQAIRYAVWQHGAAADRLAASRRNWVVEDLINEIGDCAPEGDDPPPGGSAGI